LAELQLNLKQIHDLADENSVQEQQKYVSQYSKRAVYKDFEIGQQVIVLIPDSTKKLLSRWQGPGTIVDARLPHSYSVDLDQGQHRWLHANKVRPYHTQVKNVIVNSCSIVYEFNEEFGTLSVPDITPKAEALPGSRIKLEKLSHLLAEQKRQFLTLLDEFPDLFSERPGLCKEGQHEIH